MAPLEKEEEEVKTERALGRIGLAIFKHPAVFWPLLGGAIASGWVRETPKSEVMDSFSTIEMRQILRKEIAPLRAGIEALATAQSDRVQVRVLQAMLKAEKNNREVTQ